MHLTGMRGIGRVGVLVHCGRQRCRDAVVCSSYSKAVHTLLIDGGRGFHLDPEVFETMLFKSVEMARIIGPNGTIWSNATSGAMPGSMIMSPYAKMRSIHDIMINAFISHALGDENQDIKPYLSGDPWLQLALDWLTPDHLIAPRNKKRKVTLHGVLYVILK